MVYGPMSLLPSDTEQIARMVFNRGDPYLALGDRINSIIGDLPIKNIEINPEEKNRPMLLLAVITSMQYREGFNDLQTAEAVSLRVDWKYALHLPIHYRYISPESFCEFRAHIRHNPTAKEVFQQLLNRLHEENFLIVKGRSIENVNQLIYDLCDLNRLMLIQNTFISLLESVSASCPDWLRSIALPHWYEKYFRNSEKFKQGLKIDDLKNRASSIGKDCLYFFQSIEKSHQNCQSCLSESHDLWKNWRNQFELRNDEVHWMPGVCELCEQNTVQGNMEINTN
jgi:hypothetical protein